MPASGLGARSPSLVAGEVRIPYDVVVMQLSRLSLAVNTGRTPMEGYSLAGAMSQGLPGSEEVIATETVQTDGSSKRLL